MRRIRNGFVEPLARHVPSSMRGGSLIREVLMLDNPEKAARAPDRTEGDRSVRSRTVASRDQASSV
jgi:hypothetical protein